MLASVLLDECLKAGIDFFTGVPDSFLKGLCDELYDRYGTDSASHIVAHNEGGAIGLCAGHFLASGRPALCYMQNSGLGNTVNPLTSLTDPKVYSVPCLLVVGWRGEPGTKDEPFSTCTLSGSSLIRCSIISTYFLFPVTRRISPKPPSSRRFTETTHVGE